MSAWAWYRATYLTFDGRIGRLKYLGYTLLLALPIFVAALLVVLWRRWGGFDGSLSQAVFGAAALALFGVILVGNIVGSVSLAVRRLHDFNMSGWWIAAYCAANIVMKVPRALVRAGGAEPGAVLELLALLADLIPVVLFLMPGAKGANRFGPPPAGWGRAGRGAAPAFTGPE